MPDHPDHDADDTPRPRLIREIHTTERWYGDAADVYYDDGLGAVDEDGVPLDEHEPVVVDDDDDEGRALPPSAGTGRLRRR